MTMDLFLKVKSLTHEILYAIFTSTSPTATDTIPVAFRTVKRSLRKMNPRMEPITTENSLIATM